MIQALIFDVGGVLVRTPDRRSRRQWEERLGLADRETEVIVFTGDMGTRAQSGEITSEQLWQWIGRRLALPPEELASFRRDSWAGDVLDEGLITYIRSLRPRYQTAIISNATDNLRRNLAEFFAISDAFDLIVCSAEEKLMKPNPQIYRLTLERLGREPAEALFIDDNANNVAAARHVGLSAIHFNPALDLPAELARLGVVPDNQLPTINSQPITK